MLSLSQDQSSANLIADFIVHTLPGHASFFVVAVGFHASFHVVLDVEEASERSWILIAQGARQIQTKRERTKRTMKRKMTMKTSRNLMRKSSGQSPRGLLLWDFAFSESNYSEVDICVRAVEFIPCHFEQTFLTEVSLTPGSPSRPSRCWLDLQ